jgi:hypothetical protein
LALRFDVLASFPFLRQHLRSDYCAVYATGMAMSLAGRATDRASARALFEVRGGQWSGANHAMISGAIRKALGASTGRWRHSRACTAVGLWKFLRSSSGRAYPIIATAYCRHRKLGLECGHAFVLVAADDDRVLAVDPLSCRPAQGLVHNIQIDRPSRGDLLLRVRGSSWDLCAGRRVSTLALIVD